MLKEGCSKTIFSQPSNHFPAPSELQLQVAKVSGSNHHLTQKEPSKDLDVSFFGV